jgi:hypothetical protein
VIAKCCDKHVYQASIALAHSVDSWRRRGEDALVGLDALLVVDVEEPANGSPQRHLMRTDTEARHSSRFA